MPENMSGANQEDAYEEMERKANEAETHLNRVEYELAARERAEEANKKRSLVDLAFHGKTTEIDIATKDAAEEDQIRDAEEEDRLREKIKNIVIDESDDIEKAA